MNGHVSRVSLLAFAVALVIGPGPAAAQSQDAPNVRLYETMESMTLGGSGNVIRRATAALTGSAEMGSVLCPVNLLVALCTVNVTASSTARIDTGRGTVTGDVSVVVPPGDNPFDAPETTVLSGTLRADIDLAPYPGVPMIATLTGSLQGSATKGGPLGRLIIRGSFTGTFRLPFAFDPEDPVPPSYYVIDPANFDPLDPATYRLVRYPDEYLLGYPMVLLELVLQ